MFGKVIATEIKQSTREWSELQKSIFQFVESGAGSAVVEAVAGSGKTTTIVEAARRLPTSLSCSFVAFNKSIAEELKSRLPSHIRAQTLNAMGYGAWRRHLGEQAASLRVDGNKLRSIVRDVIPDAHLAIYSKGMARLVALAKSIGLVPQALDADEYSGLVEDTDETWLDIAETFSIDTEANLEKPDEVAQLCAYARATLTRSIEVSHVLMDFDDQLYMPVITGAKFWQNDVLFIDEAQDLNRIQRIMIRRALRPRGRLIAVGDPRQAIYAFRGADATSIERIKAEFDATTLPLTVSYRCPKAVVKEAQRWVSHIQSADTASQGSVIHGDKFYAERFQPSDAILCRNMQPLVSLAFNLIRENVACQVRGRDIGAGLIALIRKFKTNDISELQSKLDDYASRQIARWSEQGKDDLIQRLQDQVGTIEIFVEALPTDATVEDLTSKIESLFTDGGRQVLTLCTVHRAKGLEWQRVYILDAAELMPSKYARTAAAKQQEANLCYVAVTRAKEELIYISSKKFVAGKLGDEVAQTLPAVPA